MVNNAPAADTLIERTNASNTDTSSNVPDEPTIIQCINTPKGIIMPKVNKLLKKTIAPI